jgi:hypothetical protein
MLPDAKTTILFLAANPIDSDPLRLGAEVRNIKDALRQAEHGRRFAVQEEWAVRIMDLRRALLRYEDQPLIVHFAGHGDGRGICLEDDAGYVQLVDGADLAQFLALFPNIQCVMLNACYSDEVGDALAAAAPCVVGMATAVTDHGAIDFATAFYDALGAGKPFGEAFAVAERSLGMAGLLEVVQPVFRLGRPATAAAAPDPGRIAKIGQDFKLDDAGLRELLASAGYAIVMPSQSVIPTQRAVPQPPRLLQRLYGRDRFLTALVTDMTAGTTPAAPLALTALQGLAGIGKTALALALANDARVAAAFPDGRVWLDLGPEIGDAERALLVDRLAARFGIQFAGNVPADQREADLAAALAGRRYLLVLDDVWRAGDARSLVSLVAPPAQVVLTTRRPQVADDLQAVQRAVWVLQPEAAVALLAGSGTHAAAAVHAAPGATRELAEALGWLPLALHVAGRRLNSLASVMDPAQAVTQLREVLAANRGEVLRMRSQSLHRGIADAEPSLEAVIALSYRALPDDGVRGALARLAVFGGMPADFDLPAAAAVWEVGETQAADWLAALRDAGLVEVLAENSTRRYAVHQVIAAFAQIRLEETPGAGYAASLAHARHYAGLVEAASDLIPTEHLITGLTWLDTELAQVRRAVAWCQAEQTSEAAAVQRQLVVPLRNYALGARSMHREYQGWLTVALVNCRQVGDTQGEANVLQAQGGCARLFGSTGGGAGALRPGVGVVPHRGRSPGRSERAQSAGGCARLFGSTGGGAGALRPGVGVVPHRGRSPGRSERAQSAGGCALLLEADGGGAGALRPGVGVVPHRGRSPGRSERAQSAGGMCSTS